MTFYLDEDLSPRIAVLLRDRGIDAVSAHEVGNRHRTDEEQLAFAARQARCLVTGDKRDFVRLAREAVSRAQPHAGIVLCPPRVRQANLAAIVKALAWLADRYPRGLGEYDVIYL